MATYALRVPCSDLSMTTDLHLPYLQGYPPEILRRVRDMARAGLLADVIARRHPQTHEIRTERALYDYVNALKSRFMKSAPPLAKVAYDPKLHILRNVLGTHSAVSRVQGNRLKAKREIRVATLFKEAPADFLRMVVVHELAHLKESEHDKGFYALCLHMEPDYHQLELDLRLWLTTLDLARADGTVNTGPGCNNPA
jgi:predicted metal-dependent hydrolase